jgi:hypothetical protein
MATDAQINQIDALSSFIVNLANFSESVTSNSNAFATLITEKMSELRLVERKAEEICQQIINERKKKFDEYACIAGSNDNESRNKLSVELQDLERKELIAKRCLSNIHQNVLVAHGAVIAMIDQTKCFNRDAVNHVDKGVAFIKRSQVNLEQYKANQK